MMNKKAVSPIVVTILLITFVIALGVVINAWMRATVQTYVDEGEKDIQTGISCLNVKMQLEEKDTGSIYIKNNGDIDISGYSAVLYRGEISDVFNHQNIAIAKYNAVEYPPLGGESLAGNDKVKIIPFITTQEGISSECTDQTITLTL